MSQALATFAPIWGGLRRSPTPTGHSVRLPDGAQNLPRLSSLVVPVVVDRRGLSPYTGALTLAAESLPSGVTVSFSPSTILANTTTTDMTITADGTPTLGAASFVLAVSGNGFTARVTQSLTILASTSATVTVTPDTANFNVSQGNSFDVRYLVVRTAYTDTVTLTAGSLPTGVTASYPDGQTFTGSIDYRRVRYTADVGAPEITADAITVTFTGTGLTPVVSNATLSVVASGLFDTVAELPRVVPVFDMAASRAYTGGDLHQPTSSAELNTLLTGGTLAGKTLKRGDRIENVAGTVYTQSATYPIPVLSGTPDPNDMSTFVHWRGAPVADLPLLGYRVDASDAATLSTVRAFGSGAASRSVRADLAAAGWVFDGIAFDGGSVTSCPGFLELGNYSTATVAADYCNWMVCNQLVMTSTYANQVIRLLAQSGTNMIERDCHIAAGGYSGSGGTDDQAINIQHGVGPYLVTNCFIQGGGENLMVGGVNPAVQDATPADITITRNHFYKPPTWNTVGGSHDGNTRVLKNLLELKSGVRVLIEGNVFQNYWCATGQKFPLKFKSTTNGSLDPAIEVSNVTVRKNYLKNCVSFVDCFDREDPNDVITLSKRFSIHDNVVDGIGNPATPQAMVQVCSIRTSFVWIFNNTMIPHASATGYSLISGDTSEAPFTDMLFQNNIGPRLSNGYRNGGLAEGTVALTRWPSCVANYNTLIGNPNLAAYPANTYKTASVATAGFVNAGAGDYHLSGGSPLLGTGLSGTNPGADIDAVNAAIAGVVTGVWP